jgi:hypothetical protein
MDLYLRALIGLCAGVHAALYGAYKDSPHESFLLRRFVRELVFATTAAIVLHLSGFADGQSAFVLYLSCFALSRIATEFWKLFVRVEPQSDFRIPTQIHFFSRVVGNPLLRVLVGVGFVAGIYGVYCLHALLPDGLPLLARGALLGGSIGVAEGIAGAYKDGSIEGFSPIKFLKSPVFGTIGGIIAALHTSHPAFLLLAAIGSMRMFLELFFKILVRDYAPGKFRSMVGPFRIWTERRRYFLAPYAATWALYSALLAVRLF